jgi:hypothetical protein
VTRNRKFKSEAPSSFHARDRCPNPGRARPSPTNQPERAVPAAYPIGGSRPTVPSRRQEGGTRSTSSVKPVEGDEEGISQSAREKRGAVWKWWNSRCARGPGKRMLPLARNGFVRGWTNLAASRRPGSPALGAPIQDLLTLSTRPLIFSLSLF